MKRFDDTARFYVSAYSIVLEEMKGQTSFFASAGKAELDSLNLRGTAPDDHAPWEAWQYINVFGMPTML